MERNHTSSRISPGAVRYSELHQQEPSSTSLDIGPSTSCGSSSKDQATPSKTNIEEIPSTSPSKTSTKEGTSRGFKSLIVLRWWLPELIASILSIASSISIVVILRNYDGRGLDNLSLPRGLTLNGIIAALSTLNRVCLMTPVGTAMSQEAWLWFSATGRKRSSRLGDLDLSDAASRGSWGSLVFLWSSRGHRLLACMGAFITILSLAFGTFTQQLLAIGYLPVVNPPSELQPGNIPRAETWANFTGSLGWGVEPLLNMKAAIINGIFTNTITPIAAVCPTANCTWPITSSLAVCGHCTPSPYTTNCIPRIIQNKTYGSTCNYTMPSGRSRRCLVMTMSLAREVLQPQLSKRPYLANFDVFGAPYGTTHTTRWPEERWPNASTVSLECALWMCVQTYNTTVQAGQHVQAIVASFDDSENTPGTSPNFLPLPAEVIGANITHFNISYDALAAIGPQLSSVLDGNATLNRKRAWMSSDAIEAIWNGTTNIDHWIQNFATSMTNIVRTDIPLSRDIFDGTAYQLAYVVRWRWLALPVVTVLLSVLFWVVIMVQTARSSVAAWKGSPLTFLLFGVDEETKQSVYGQVEKYRGIEKAVARKEAVLVSEPRGLWKFRPS